MNRRMAIIALLAIFMLGAVTGALVWRSGQGGSLLTAASAQTEGLCGNEQNVIQVAKTVGPSVVTVLNMQSPSPGAPVERAGLGSGFFVRQDGLIVTNAHLVAGADRVEVVLIGERTVTATVLGADPRIDVAILKVRGDDWTVATLGDSDRLQVGQEAIAIGNPVGFERTVTMGVVSAVNRAIPGGGTALRELIQTDAAINPGNSGGPLLDSCGRAIGVNTVMVGTARGGGGLGFAVPINVVKRAIRDIEQTGRIAVPWMGIAYSEITPETARSLDLPVQKGLVIGSVAPGSPAAQAGIREGDIIVELNGKTLEDAAPLQEFIRDASVGDRLGLTLLRDGRRTPKTIVLREMP
ncbi:MAG: S1C family serine protease [Armatimonadota bacterium]